MVVSAVDPREVDALLERAEAAFAGERWVAAASDFNRAADLDPRGPRAAAARLHAAWAHDNAARHEAALAGYEAVAREHPADPQAREALVRALRLLCHLEQWVRAGEVADLVLSRYPDLRALERIVARGAKALSLVAGDDPESATPHLAHARRDIERLGLDREAVIHRDVAQVFYALGEQRRRRGDRIVFDPMPEDFGAALEERCQLLLDAQNAYAEAMRAQDAHWSAMAGVRIGELYQRLHDDLMAMPRPAGARDDAGRVALFEGAMRLRYATLLRKGLSMMDHTVAMAERTGERSAWVARAREARSELERGLRREEAAVAALPYSRAELRAALDAVRRRHVEPSNPSTRIRERPGPAGRAGGG